MSEPAIKDQAQPAASAAQPGAPAAQAKSSKAKMRAIAAVLFVAAGVGIYVFLHRNEETMDDAQVEATVNTIAPKVNGYIAALPVKDNQFVKAGDVLMQIDPTDYKIRLEKAEASLAAAEARVHSSSMTLETTRISAPSNVDSAQADQERAQSDWENANKNLKRVQSLSDEARSQQQVDNAIAQEKSAKASLDSATAKLRDAQTAPKTVAAAEANTAELSAAVKQAAADVAQAQSDLDNTKIVAPITGRVTNKSIQQGDYVQPGQQLFSLVGTDVYVVANFKETQLKRIKVGDPVDIRIDAYEDLGLKGQIDSFQFGTGARFSAFPPENATGNFVKIVQRVPVKIVFTNLPNDPLTLGPGMSVVPVVYVK